MLVFVLLFFALTVVSLVQLGYHDVLVGRRASLLNSRAAQTSEFLESELPAVRAIADVLGVDAGKLRRTDCFDDEYRLTAHPSIIAIGDFFGPSWSEVDDIIFDEYSLKEPVLVSNYASLGEYIEAVVSHSTSASE